MIVSSSGTKKLSTISLLDFLVISIRKQMFLFECFEKNQPRKKGQNKYQREIAKSFTQKECIITNAMSVNLHYCKNPVVITHTKIQKITIFSCLLFRSFNWLTKKFFTIKFKLHFKYSVFDPKKIIHIKYTFLHTQGFCSGLMVQGFRSTRTKTDEY